MIKTTEKFIEELLEMLDEKAEEISNCSIEIVIEDGAVSKFTVQIAEPVEEEEEDEEDLTLDALIEEIKSYTDSILEGRVKTNISNVTLAKLLYVLDLFKK